MAKKLFFSGLVVLFCLSFLPLQAKATLTSNALQPGTLIKASNPAIYYFGADNKRYVFPNEKTYKTWFVSFSSIMQISDDLLGSIPIGGNVTYKPGKKLVKITTDPKVYWVDKSGTLRWVKTESVAKQLFGSDWQDSIDDLPDPFFINYKVGMPLETSEVSTIETNYSINQDKELSNETDPTTNELGTIDLTGTITGNRADLKWSVNNFTSEQGFKIVMGNQPDPVYPGNDYHYLSDPNTRTDQWNDLAPGTYYFRACEYLGGQCGIYSNNLILKVGESATIDNSSGSISLIGSWNAEKNKVILEWKPINLYSDQGFKIVYSTEPNPVYPGNEYHYLSDPNSRTDSWTGLKAGTYHFRVCEYLGGKCGIYSNDITVTVPSTIQENLNSQISLDGYYDESNNQVVLTWQSNFSILNGIKVVKSTQINPAYPGNDYHFLEGQYLMNEFSQDPPGGTDIWKNLTAGTYHFRACEYLGGACGIYSNDIAVTVPGVVTDNSNGSITLTGNYEASLDKVLLNWSVIDMYSDLGFKVVYSTNPNPVYPGNEYHYLTDPDVRSDSWSSLEPGTYHFRVCEYLGGACGIYSNDITVNVQ